MGAVFLESCLYVILPTKQCFEDYVVNARPKQIHVNANLLEMLTESTETPFVAKIVLLRVFVLNKPFVLLVD